MTDVALASTGVSDDPDCAALVAALGDVGLRGLLVAWADETVDWSSFDATVIRSTWDYPMAHSEFLAWTRGVPNLHNAPDVVAWNSDKRYLADLADLGVPTIPTTYATSGATAVFPDGDVVVKPTVSGGSRGAARFGAGERTAARRHVDTIAALGVEAMVQPLVASVAEHGETDVVTFDGTVSHAVQKHAPIGGEATETPSGPVGVDPVAATDAQLAVVDAALRAVPFASPLCYARVDLVELATGPAVIEVELIEPFLFLAEHPEAAARFAASIARRVAH